MQELARRTVEPPGDSEAEEEKSWLEKLGATNTSSNLSLVDEEKLERNGNHGASVTLD